MNSAEGQEKKKEAILLIINFFHSLKLRNGILVLVIYFSLEVPYETNSGWKRIGFHIVEALYSSFYTLLSSSYLPLQISTILLIHNLCCANKHFMRKMMHEYEIYDILFSFSAVADHKIENNGFLECIAKEEWVRSHVDCIRDGFDMIARILSILIEGSQDYLISLMKHSKFNIFVKNLFYFNFSSRYKEVKLSICALLCNILQNLDVQEKNSIEVLMESSILKNAFSLSAFCLKLPHFTQRSRGYSLISQLFSWQFMIGRESVVESLLLDESDNIGKNLTKILIENTFDSSFESAEILAAQNCLQFLLGNFDFAKEIALSSKFYLKVQHIISRSDPSLSEVSRGFITLISKLCSNCQRAKITCGSVAYLQKLSNLISPSGEINISIHEEAIGSLINLTRNCTANALKVCNNSSTKDSSLSLLEVLISQICNTDCNLKIFRNLIEIISCLFSHKEVRNMTVKVKFPLKQFNSLEGMFIASFNSIS